MRTHSGWLAGRLRLARNLAAVLVVLAGGLVASNAARAGERDACSEEAKAAARALAKAKAAAKADVRAAVRSGRMPRQVTIEFDSAGTHIVRNIDLRRALQRMTGTAATGLGMAMAEADRAMAEARRSMEHAEELEAPEPPSPADPAPPAEPAPAPRARPSRLSRLGTPGTAPTPPTPATPGVAPTPPPASWAPPAGRLPRYTPDPERARRAPRRRGRDSATTDTVFAVTPGASLELDTFMGDINIEGWPRNAIRIRAEHDAHEGVVASWEGRVLKLDGESSRGPASFDWNVQVPSWLPVKLACVTGDITVSGTTASIEAQSIRGDVKVSGGGGVLDLNSVEGEVVVAGSRGTIRAGSVNNGLRLVRVIGEIDAQSVNGDIEMSDLESPRVDASTVNGSVWFAGAFRDRGRYRFASHNGSLYVGVPAGAGLDLSVNAFNGEFRTALPMPSPRAQRGKRFEFVLGDGGASVDLESFNGLIRLLRPIELTHLRNVSESNTPAPGRTPEEKEKDR